MLYTMLKRIYSKNTYYAQLSALRLEPRDSPRCRNKSVRPQIEVGLNQVSAELRGQIARAMERGERMMRMNGPGRDQTPRQIQAQEGGIEEERGNFLHLSTPPTSRSPKLRFLRVGEQLSASVWWLSMMLGTRVRAKIQSETRVCTMYQCDQILSTTNTRTDPPGA